MENYFLFSFFLEKDQYARRIHSTGNLERIGGTRSEQIRI